MVWKDTWNGVLIVECHVPEIVRWEYWRWELEKSYGKDGVGDSVTEFTFYFLNAVHVGRLKVCNFIYRKIFIYLVFILYICKYPKDLFGIS